MGIAETKRDGSVVLHRKEKTMEVKVDKDEVAAVRLMLQRGAFIEIHGGNDIDVGNKGTLHLITPFDLIVRIIGDIKRGAYEDYEAWTRRT